MKKLGFTLAEVLITLVIIGVIAAMTVPTLMNNTNSQEFRSALKKAISGANQALTLHYALEGLGAQDYTHETLVSDVFKRRMNVIEATDNDASFTLSTACGGTTFTTQDGIMFCVNSNFAGNTADTQDAACNSYNTIPCVTGATNDEADANFYIDVNGRKNPNKLTTTSNQPRDIYTAHIYNQKIVPYGDATQQVMFDKQVSTGS
ncbi:type II secretion system protein [bacterium]|nr:type II secretion system protein [bacterium]